ncbi:MAG TPA: hypothetical protein PK264_03850, partial [Hyphomicrobiaceae bacterium]|nr:hypothetical protein [Hyphomicrobiaceae bacterium]
MRKTLNSAWIPGLVGLAGIAALAFAPGLGSSALANGPKRGAPMPGTVASFAPEHQSTLRIRESDRLPLHKGVRLGRNKSMLVELPREL